MPDTPRQPPEDRTAAFVELLSKHEQRVKSYLLSLVPHWPDMEDLYADTNLRLWEQFDQFQRGTDFGAWACSVAHYLVLDFRKKRSRERLVFSDQLLEIVAQYAAEGSGASSADHAALVDCIAHLSEQNRELLRQCYSGEFSIKEVAARRGRSAASVYVTLSRLRKWLARCIDRQLTEGAD